MYKRCPDTVYGEHSLLDNHGKCSWCGKIVGFSSPKPKSFPTSNLEDAYRYFYDPDYGYDKE